VTREVLRTRFGQVYLVRLIILVALATPLRMRLLRHELLARWWSPAGIATGAALLVTPGLARHAATGSLVVPAVPFDLVHVAAAAVWVGGLFVLATAVLTRLGAPDQPSPLRNVVARYSRWALIAVVAIAASGGLRGLASGREPVRGNDDGVRSRPAPVGWFSPRPSSSQVSSRWLPEADASSTVTWRFRSVWPDPTNSAATPRRHLRRSLPQPPRRSTATRNRPPVQRPWGDGSARQQRATWADPRTRQISCPTGVRRESDLRVALMVELVLAAMVIAVTAVLVSAQPSRQVLNRPFSAEVHAGPCAGRRGRRPG